MNQWQIGQVRVTQGVDAGPTPTATRLFWQDPPDGLVPGPHVAPR